MTETAHPLTLTVSNLSAGYRKRQVIDNVSIAGLQGGTMTALVGPNAAGKTTLLRSIAGLNACSGSIRLGEQELAGTGIAQRARSVSYMPQTLPQRVALSVFEAMLGALNASPVSGIRREDFRHQAMETLERLGIAHLASRGLDELSGGQRQLASLAQAIARRPAVLLLDEPTSALDLAHQFRVMDTVRQLTVERGMISVLVLHDIAMACRWCQRVVVLAKGDIVADGSPENAVTPAMLEKVYGVSARVERCSQGSLQILTDALAPVSG